jgi:hypothetical protein
MMDFGLIQKYFKDEMDKVGIIKDEKKIAKSAKALSFHHLEGAFAIYGWVTSYSKCYNWHRISKLSLNFGCLFTFCYLDSANSIKIA